MSATITGVVGHLTISVTEPTSRLAQEHYALLLDWALAELTRCSSTR